MEYSAGMASCLFWLSETRMTAKLLIDGKSKDDIKELALKENIYQVKSEDRKRRIFGVAFKRLESLPDIFMHQIAEGDIGTVKILILISIMKTELLFFEFVYEVYRQAIILGENRITYRAINEFFDRKRVQSEIVGSWSEILITRLKQLFPKMLLEAGVLNSSTGERKVIIPPVDYKLRKLLEDNNLKVYLNAILGEE